MTEWRQYRRTAVSEMRPYVPGENMTDISISREDAKAGSPKYGDWIARNPLNHDDQWLMSAAYVEMQKFEQVGE